MCTFPQMSINQTKAHSSFQLAVDISPNLDVSCQSRVQKMSRKRFNVHLSGDKQQNNVLQKHLFPGRDKKNTPSETRVFFHKDYLIKRLKDPAPDFASTKKLFEEITARGYQGSLRTLQRFLSETLNKKEVSKKAFLEFHKKYLTKRVEDAAPDFVSTKKLFEEITARGYQGSLSTLRKFLCTVRKKAKITKNTLLCFHKDYLIKRLEDTMPNYVSTRKLFEEITAKGYRGSIITLRRFLSTVRKKEEMPSEAPLCFHKEYLTKRVEDTWPKYVSTRKLFEEITARGYQGSLRTLRRFLSETFKKKEVSKGAFLEFHKDYLIQTVEKLSPDRVSAKQLFKEMSTRGYRGTHKEIEVFLMMISK